MVGNLDAKRWYLESELVMGVSWVEHKSNQSEWSPPIPLKRDVVLAAGPYAPPFQNHASHQQLCLTVYENKH